MDFVARLAFTALEVISNMENSTLEYPGGDVFPNGTDVGEVFGNGTIISPVDGTVVDEGSYILVSSPFRFCSRPPDLTAWATLAHVRALAHLHTPAPPITAHLHTDRG